MPGAAVTNLAQQGIQGLTKGRSALDGKSEMRHVYISGSQNYHVTESLGSLFSHRAPALPSFSTRSSEPQPPERERGTLIWKSIQVILMCGGFGCHGGRGPALTCRAPSSAERPNNGRCRGEVSWQASKKKLSREEEGGFIRDRRGFLYVVMVRAL